MSRFDEILERNRRIAAGGTAELRSGPEAVPLVVVSCFEPALDPLLPAIGLNASEAMWFRTAGALVPRESSTLRDLMVAIFLLQAEDVLVVGHNLCRMASFDTSGFIDAFRARGVPREAFGADDLRDWAGALASPRRGVELSIQTIRSAPSCPRELGIHGALLDEKTARLSPVEVTSSPPEAPPETRPEIGEAAKPPLPAAPRPAAPPAELLRDFLQESTRWRSEIDRLRTELARQKSPFAKLRLMTAFVKRVGVESKEVVVAFEELKKQVGSSTSPALAAEELVKRLERVLNQP